jgi:aspartyl-tRNA(Asn)/glutamyl-tRNA(Gln) amidotransferase subunit A
MAESTAGRYRYSDISALREAFAREEISPLEHANDVLSLAETAGAGLGAFLTVDRAGATAAAAAATERIREHGREAWRRQPLLGIPVSVKDLIPTKGLRTTRGSLMFENWVPGYDPPAVARLRAAGAVIVGKTSTSEFGWSASGNSLLAGPVRNPWAPALSAGGSSGGAAVSVAAGIVPAGLGTDGAGSVRIPAAFCGVVGFKPSFGCIPYVPASPENLSHLGTLTRSTADAALMLSVLAGADARDGLSYQACQGTWEISSARDRRFRIGWIRSLGEPEPEPEAEHLAAEAAAALREAGHTLVDLAPPFGDPYGVLEVILAAAEAAATEPGTEHLADPGRLAVAEMGRRLSAVDLARAQRARAQFCDQVREAMTTVDLLAMPTVPVSPFPAELVAVAEPVRKGRLPWLAWTPATYPFNLTGQPAISVPAGVTSGGLPAGLQLAGRWRSDTAVLVAAQELERLRPWSASYARLADNQT